MRRALELDFMAGNILTSTQSELVQCIAERREDVLPPGFFQEFDRSVGCVADEESASIPVIDMSDLSGEGKENGLKKLAAACEEWGFFQVINHGMPETVTSNMKKVSREFYRMPLEVRNKVSRKEGQLVGYGRYDSSSRSTHDWVDIFSHHTEGPLKDIAEWPKAPSNFIGVTEEYSKHLKNVITNLVAVLSESLGLESDYIKNMSGEYISLLRINYYPPCPQPDKVLGLSSHSDASTITVVIEDTDAPGSLQIRKEGNWIPVKALPGALVINTGDVLEVVSNGRYKSVDHRVVVSKDSDRLSVVMFHGPVYDPEVLIHPAKPLLSEQFPARYRSISYQDYVKFYLTYKSQGKARVESLLIQG